MRPETRRRAWRSERSKPSPSRSWKRESASKSSVSRRCRLKSSSSIGSHGLWSRGVAWSRQGFLGHQLAQRLASPRSSRTPDTDRAARARRGRHLHCRALPGAGGLPGFEQVVGTGRGSAQSCGVDGARRRRTRSGRSAAASRPPTARTRDLAAGHIDAVVQRRVGVPPLRGGDGGGAGTRTAGTGLADARARTPAWRCGRARGPGRTRR